MFPLVKKNPPSDNQYLKFTTLIENLNTYQLFYELKVYKELLDDYELSSINFYKQDIEDKIKILLGKLRKSMNFNLKEFKQKIYKLSREDLESEIQNQNEMIDMVIISETDNTHISSIKNLTVKLNLLKEQHVRKYGGYKCLM